MCWKIQVQKKGRFFFFFPVGGGRHLIVSTIAFENQSSVAHVVNAILNLPWLWYVQNGQMYVSLSQIRGEEMQARGYVCVGVLRKPHENMNKEMYIIHCSGNHLTTSLRKRLCQGQGKRKVCGFLKKLSCSINQTWNSTLLHASCFANEQISLLFELGWVRLGAEINAVTI